VTLGNCPGEGQKLLIGDNLGVGRWCFDVGRGPTLFGNAVQDCHIVLPLFEWVLSVEDLPRLEGPLVLSLELLYGQFE
jgi:hypothetical protein